MNKKKRKAELRQMFLERRSNIDEEVYLEKSAQICSKLKALPIFQKAHVIHCYISMNGRREVNTHLLIKSMLAAAKKVVVPVTDIESGTLSHAELETFEDLQENEWGVLEPVNPRQAAVSDLDLVIVPMVGGDHRQNRLGYGKGYYDRFLQQLKCPTAGLLFECCLIEEIPHESFDVPLSMLVTENEIFS